MNLVSLHDCWKIQLGVTSQNTGWQWWATSLTSMDCLLAADTFFSRDINISEMNSLTNHHLCDATQKKILNLFSLYTMNCRNRRKTILPPPYKHFIPYTGTGTHSGKCKWRRRWWILIMRPLLWSVVTARSITISVMNCPVTQCKCADIFMTYRRSLSRLLSLLIVNTPWFIYACEVNRTGFAPCPS